MANKVTIIDNTAILEMLKAENNVRFTNPYYKTVNNAKVDVPVKHTIKRLELQDLVRKDAEGNETNVTNVYCVTEQKARFRFDADSLPLMVAGATVSITKKIFVNADGKSTTPYWEFNGVVGAAGTETKPELTAEQIAAGAAA